MIIGDFEYDPSNEDARMKALSKIIGQKARMVKRCARPGCNREIRVENTYCSVTCRAWHKNYEKHGVMGYRDEKEYSKGWWEKRRRLRTDGILQKTG